MGTKQGAVHYYFGQSKVLNKAFNLGTSVHAANFVLGVHVRTAARLYTLSHLWLQHSQDFLLPPQTINAFTLKDLEHFQSCFCTGTLPHLLRPTLQHSDKASVHCKGLKSPRYQPPTAVYLIALGAVLTSIFLQERIDHEIYYAAETFHSFHQNLHLLWPQTMHTLTAANEPLCIEPFAPFQLGRPPFFSGWRIRVKTCCSRQA